MCGAVPTKRRKILKTCEKFQILLQVDAETGLVSDIHRLELLTQDTVLIEEFSFKIYPGTLEGDALGSKNTSSGMKYY